MNFFRVSCTFHNEFVIVEMQEWVENKKRKMKIKFQFLEKDEKSSK